MLPRSLGMRRLLQAMRPLVSCAVTAGRFCRKMAILCVSLLRRHPAFTESVALGCIAAALLRLAPPPGTWLAPYVLVVAIMTGLVLEIRGAFSQGKPNNSREDS